MISFGRVGPVDVSLLIYGFLHIYSDRCPGIYLLSEISSSLVLPCFLITHHIHSKYSTHCLFLQQRNFEHFIQSLLQPSIYQKPKEREKTRVSRTMNMKYRAFILFGMIVGSTSVIVAGAPLLPRDATATAAPPLSVKGSGHDGTNLASLSRTDEDVTVPSPEVGNTLTRYEETTEPSPDVHNTYKRKDEEVDVITRDDIFPNILTMPLFV